MTLVTIIANDHLVTARRCAVDDNLRDAYHHVYRGLDIYLRLAEWNKVSSELKEITSDKYPVAFGMGALRFSAGSRNNIPDWKEIIEKFVVTIINQNKSYGDPSKLLRGLWNKKTGVIYDN